MEGPVCKQPFRVIPHLTGQFSSLENQVNVAVHFFQQGAEQGFTWFFHQLYPSLTLYCFKIIKDKDVSEEIASAAFMKIWQRHHQFTDAPSIKAYLYRIVRNDALKYLAKQKQWAGAAKEVIYLYGGEHQGNAFNALVAAETARLLLKAIDRLPLECGKVFRLLYLEGKSIKETAEALRLSPSTVKTQKARGLEALRKSFRLSLMVTIGALASLFTSCLL